MLRKWINNQSPKVLVKLLLLLRYWLSYCFFFRSCENPLFDCFISDFLSQLFFRAAGRTNAELLALGMDVTGRASRELNPRPKAVGAFDGVKRSDGRVTVARVELPLPSTPPGFFHVSLDSSGLCKDVPTDHLYSFRLDAYDLLTENDEARAQVAPVRNAVPCVEPLAACFHCFSLFWLVRSQSCMCAMQMMGRILPMARTIALTQGVPTQKQVDHNVTWKAWLTVAYQPCSRLLAPLYHRRDGLASSRSRDAYVLSLPFRRLLGRGEA